MHPKPTDEPAQRVELHIPWKTIAKVLVAIPLAYIAWSLWPLCVMVFLSALVAVTLHPVVNWLRARGFAHWAAVLTVALVMIVLVGGGVTLVVPPLIEQGTGLVKALPKLQEAILAKLPADGYFHDTVKDLFNGTTLPDSSEMLKNAVSWGTKAIEALTWMGLILILAIYLLLDGHHVYRWLLPYFPPRARARIAQTAVETSEVVFAYMAGQIITSVICAIYAFVVLLALHVPAALILAVLAGVLDVLPIIGFFISTIPAALLALAVSPTAAILVVLLYVLYHALESYVIVPKVYGQRLRLSTLSVLVALLAGGLLAGIPGALAILPIVASYPIIERIWLKEYLGREVVQKHAEQMKEEEDQANQGGKTPAAAMAKDQAKETDKDQVVPPTLPG